MNFKITLKDLQTTKPLQRLLDYMKPDKQYILEIKASKEKRSLNQNDYYFGVVVSLFCQKTGYTKEEGHQILKYKFLSYHKEMKHIDPPAFTKSTTELNTLEFEQYLEQCRLFMWHEFSVKVPLPNEVDEDFLIQMSNIYNY